MASRKRSPARDPDCDRPDGERTDPKVQALLDSLDHPLKAEIEIVRGWLLGADPEIREAVKWNAPSFRTTEFFATFHLRSTEQVQLVFHTGAKVKASAVTGLDVADPTGLVKWLAKDRGLISLGSGTTLRARRAAFEDLVREWIRHLGSP